MCCPWGADFSAGASPSPHLHHAGADSSRIAGIEPAMKRELVEFIRGLVRIEAMGAREPTREIRNFERIASGKGASAADHLLLKSRDDGFRQIGTVKEVVQILQKIAVAKDIDAAGAIALEHLQTRFAMAAYEIFRVGEEFPPGQWNSFALRERAHQRFHGIRDRRPGRMVRGVEIDARDDGFFVRTTAPRISDQ